MKSTTTESYDEILYPSYAHKQTHPDRLSVVSRLFGMNPAPVERCRVLELGCGNGSNLIPMAFNLPGSDFVGIDRAVMPIETGNAMVRELQLKNISLLQRDLLELSQEIGQFDYIIAHGLYSWVPDDVKARILDICRSHLNPQGVAFISYNAYPGGHLRDMLRQMLLFHVRDLSAPQQRINQAVALLHFLINSQTKGDTYTEFLREELDQTLKLDQGHLYHDQLGNINNPLYFYQFASQAAQRGLQFLAEADFYEMQYHIYPEQTVNLLSKLATENVILKEQYLDFVKCRRFRQTLLCHGEVKIDPQPDPQALKKLYVASGAKPITPESNLSPEVVEQFVGPRGAKVATDYPLAKAALTHLSRVYPLSMHFDDLITVALALRGSGNGQNNIEAGAEAQALSEILLHTYAAGLLELFSRAPDYVTRVGEHPRASALARWQIERGTIVTNQRHINVEVEDELGRQLLMLLDGTRNREMLLNDLSSKPIFDEKQAALRDSSPERPLLAQGLEENLEKLAKLALLVS
jgi:methyltransferase-like protein/2-polyprenyl-3-methyl-5-hydroxy-6-metoxy-1,4-benzoquinol methylase